MMKILQITIVLALAGALGACGGSSGASTTANPQTQAPDVSTYNGPQPSTADVQAFKLHVWDNLVPNNRCGSCHNESQSPRFVRADDINLAYDEANPTVNLNDPGTSLMVTKVREGHNCWESSADVCGDIIQGYIEDWSADTLGGTTNTIQLTAPTLSKPAGTVEVYASTRLQSAKKPRSIMTRMKSDFAW